MSGKAVGQGIGVPPVDWSAWAMQPSAGGLLCDYDGTLAPIVEDRDHAEPLAGVTRTLTQLAGRLQVVGVVSGRPLEFLVPKLGPPKGVSLFGLYGLERLYGGPEGQGAARVSEAALAWKDVVGLAAAQAELAAPPGVEVERKGFSFALHSRRHPELASWALEWARDKALEKGLVVQPGRLSVELLPPVGFGKGTVVEDVSKSLRALCYIGDDSGDLPAFEALRRLRCTGKATLAVGVASPEQPAELAGVVDLLVSGPDGVLQLLRGLARRLGCT